VLDNYATVAEAVDALAKESFAMVPPALPNGYPAQLHLSISDPTGDSAVFEYVGGKLSIDHGKQYQVMTNEPPMDQQAALTAYWNTIGGQAFLPGTISRKTASSAPAISSTPSPRRPRRRSLRRFRMRPTPIRPFPE
jgi:choloylglycine hydrolase